MSDELPTGGYVIRGWIGTAKEAGSLKDEDGESLNKIIIMVRGKLAQEDILEEFGEGGIYSKYLIGEINADFLDVDDKDDIATSSRQKVIEHDPRYQVLKEFILAELKIIQNSWTLLRIEKGTAKALEIPQIKDWFEELRPVHRKHAQSLFGKINQLPIDSEEEKRRLIKHSVLAFESLRYKERLEALENISPDDLQTLTEIFLDLDDIEATLYHQIVRERVQIITTLNEKVEESAKEKVVQEHLFKHMWLLDPAWERATDDFFMEKTVQNVFGDINAGLTDEEKKSRVDIKYKLFSGKHIVVELKKADRLLSTDDLLPQVRKYRTALRKLLRAAGRANEPLEFICIVGRDLKDWAESDDRETSRNNFAALDARVILYDELINNAYSAYQEFLTRSKEAGRIYRLIESIDEKIGGEEIADVA